MNINNFQISKDSTLRDALELIDSNKSGTIFVIDIDGIVIGVATDGDIRRKLLEGVQLDDGLENIYNAISFPTTLPPLEKLLLRN